MDSSTLVALIALGGTLVTGFFTHRVSGRATDVNARAAELGWVKELRQDAADARSELHEARTEVDGLRVKVRDMGRQLDVVTREADHWIAEVQLLRRHVWRRGMTLERLRELVGPVDGVNGRADD